MKLVRLGAAYSTHYTPTELIEGYISLIWTERFQSPGEFELKSYDINRMKELLPLDTLISHLETKEVMRVETHSIEMEGEGEDAVPVITVSGRSAYAILEDRWVEGEYQRKRTLQLPYTASTLLCILLWQAVDNPHGVDVTRTKTYPWTTLDVIPNVAVTEATPSGTMPRWWQLEQGPLLDQFQKIMVDADLGLRTIRPTLPNNGTVITVGAAPSVRGKVNRTPTQNISALRFEVYAGTDRSATVKFSQLQGHLNKSQYLHSVKDYKTVVEIMSGVYEVTDVYRTGESGLSGWRRRLVSMDAGTPEIPAAPEKPERLTKNPTKAERNKYEREMDEYRSALSAWKAQRASIVATFRAENIAEAQRLLKEHRKTNMFAGDISDLSPYKYGEHYFLGDTVLLVGDYNMSAKMVVQEYVRTEDANGDRGIPGLVEP